MKLPVAPGEKYGLIALNCHTDIKAPINLGNGFWTAPKGALELASHWKEWLGTIRNRELLEADLLLIVTGPTDRPEVLDRDNQELLRRVDALYWGLLAATPLLISGQGMRVTGANVGGTIEVRSASNFNMTFHMRGLCLGNVTADVMARAAKLAVNLVDLLAMPGVRRLKMAVSTFLKAFWESDNSEAIHQFVRAVDGVTRAWNKDQFRDRCATFVEDTASPGCRELYIMRSNAEHFREPDAMLPPLSPPKAYMRSWRRPAEAQVLARYCMSRLVERKELWPALADAKGEEFWDLAQPDREALWGARMNLAAAMGEFDERMIPEDG